MKTIDKLRGTHCRLLLTEYQIKKLKKSAIEDIKEFTIRKEKIDNKLRKLRKEDKDKKMQKFLHEHALKWASIIGYIKKKFNLKEEDIK